MLTQSKHACAAWVLRLPHNIDRMMYDPFVVKLGYAAGKVNLFLVCELGYCLFPYLN